MQVGASTRQKGGTMAINNQLTKNYRGMVTAELAVGILAACVVTALLVWAISLIGLQAVCSDIASQIARFEARGDNHSAAVVKTKAPRDSVIEVERKANEIIVTVSAERSLGLLGPIPVSAEVSQPIEPR